jgi:hypothetical protein
MRGRARKAAPPFSVVRGVFGGIDEVAAVVSIGVRLALAEDTLHEIVGDLAEKGSELAANKVVERFVEFGRFCRVEDQLDCSDDGVFVGADGAAHSLAFLDLAVGCGHIGGTATCLTFIPAVGGGGGSRTRDAFLVSEAGGVIPVESPPQKIWAAP